jgi:uridine kinase
MKRDLNDLKEYFIEASRNSEIFVIAIDGPGASGKSVFTEKLRTVLTHCHVLHLDDFYLPGSDPSVIGSNFDWQRLLKQVLEPLKTKNTIQYRAFNWNTNELDDWKIIQKQKFFIIEGVTSGRYELRQYVDFIIFIDTPYENRLLRGIERDGIEAKDKWINDWMPREQRYVESKLHKPKENANLVIDGTYETAEDVNTINTVKERSEYFS